jgi:hypothetical protein
MQTEIPTISPGQLHYKQLYGHRPALLDVRTQAEYRAILRGRTSSTI